MPHLCGQWVTSSISRGATLASAGRADFDAAGSGSSQSRFRSTNFSEKSVRMSAKTSPLRPCVWRMCASQTQSSGVVIATSQGGPYVSATGLSGLVFFQNVERVAVMHLHADSAQYGAYRTGGTSLFAADLAHVLRRHAELEDSVFITAHTLH